MREDRLDIRQFSFPQIVDFMGLVADSQPQDLYVFKKYLDAAISQDYFSQKILDKHFDKYIQLMHGLALNNEYSQGSSMLKFLLMLKEKALASSNDDIVHQRLIDIIWTLTHRDSHQESQRGRHQANPLIPRLLELLYNYQREEPLAK